MQLQNSYIFIPNPYKKKEAPKEQEGGALYINVGRGFISCLIRAFPTASKTPERRNFFKSEYTHIVELDGNSVEAKFLINKVVEKYYLDVIVTGKSKEKLVNALEYVQAAIEKSDISRDYIKIVSYDAISEYYCNKIYPKLNELERNLRKLLLNIYVVNFGRDYYQATISGDLQDKIKTVIQAKGNEQKKEIERLQKFFYSMEFSDIQQMLFVPQWTEVDEKLKNDFLKNHEDLSKLPDDKLRKAFSDIAPRSDWERFFADKMDGDVVRSLIDEIRKNRNSIAHCKFFYQAEYTDCNKAMNKFNKAVMSAIAMTEDNDFAEKNSEIIKKALASTVTRFEEFKMSVAEALRPIIQFSQQIYEVIAPIREIAIMNRSIMSESLQSVIQSFSQLIPPMPPSGFSAELEKHSNHGNDEDEENNDDCQSNEGEDD